MKGRVLILTAGNHIKELIAQLRRSRLNDYYSMLSSDSPASVLVSESITKEFPRFSEFAYNPDLSTGNGAQREDIFKTIDASVVKDLVIVTHADKHHALVEHAMQTRGFGEADMSTIKMLKTHWCVTILDCERKTCVHIPYAEKKNAAGKPRQPITEAELVADEN